MPERIGGQSQKAGLSPGSLVHIGQKFRDNPLVKVLEYNEKDCREKEWDLFESWPSPTERSGVVWINIIGIHDIHLLERFGREFGIHLLVLEDILNTKQRPKFEDYGTYFFIILKNIAYEEQAKRLQIEQVSMIVGENFVVTFEEKEGEPFRAVRERVMNGKGLIRKAGADFLAYSLLDAVVDDYFLVMETIGEEIELLEEKLVSQTAGETVHRIHKMKREILLLRKTVWPLREVIGNMEKGVTSIIKDATVVYLRDVYDHVIEMVDVIETFRDMLSGMLDIYLSSVSNRMNEIMKVLTVISTIFIPLTFISGVYGMNFKFMPELNSRWGYPGVLGFMLLAGVFMLFYFRRKKWL